MDHSVEAVIEVAAVVVFIIVVVVGIRGMVSNSQHNAAVHALHSKWQGRRRRRRSGPF
jgi:L-asparagine transporter-like permease